MGGYLDTAITFIRENAFWAGPAVACVTFGESLPFVGILIPATTFLIAVGALIFQGTLDAAWVLLWAIPGAVAGNAASYFLGSRFQNSIPAWKPFRKRPQLLDRARGFVVRHGGKSLLVARFFGPLRCTVPLAAGMLSMPTARFYLCNVLSALVWAPTVLVWGAVVGTVIGMLWKLENPQLAMIAAVAVATAGALWYARARLMPGARR